MQRPIQLRKHNMMFTISQIFHIIVGEATAGCTDADATMSYFKQYHKHQYYVDDLECFVKCLDFDAIRNKSHVLYNMA